MKLVPTSIKHLGDEYSIKNSLYLPTEYAKNPSKVINVKIFNRVFKCGFHKDIEKGKVGMSLNMRKFMGISENSDTILV
jgi:hypothetical protein